MEQKEKKSDFVFHKNQLIEHLLLSKSSLYAKGKFLDDILQLRDMLDDSEEITENMVQHLWDTLNNCGHAILDLKKARLHAIEILSILGKAEKSYREGQHGKAARILGWTTGKRRTSLENERAVGFYIIYLSEGLPPKQAFNRIADEFRWQSKPALSKFLRREREKLGGDFPVPTFAYYD